jgi:hypothetical protein
VLFVGRLGLWIWWRKGNKKGGRKGAMKANEVRSQDHIFLSPLVWAKTAEAPGFRNGSDQGMRLPSSDLC